MWQCDKLQYSSYSITRQNKEVADNGKSEQTVSLVSFSRRLLITGGCLMQALTGVTYTSYKTLSPVCRSLWRPECRLQFSTWHRSTKLTSAFTPTYKIKNIYVIKSEVCRYIHIYIITSARDNHYIITVLQMLCIPCEHLKEYICQTYIIFSMFNRITYY